MQGSHEVRHPDYDERTISYKGPYIAKIYLMIHIYLYECIFIFHYLAEPVPYLDLFWAEPVTKNTLYLAYTISDFDDCSVSFYLSSYDDGDSCALLEEKNNHITP